MQFYFDGKNSSNFLKTVLTSKGMHFRLLPRLAKKVKNTSPKVPVEHFYETLIHTFYIL